MPAKRRDPLPPDDAQALLFPEPASTVSAMAGWSGPLTPLAPEITIDSSAEMPEPSVAAVLRRLQELGIIPAAGIGLSTGPGNQHELATAEMMLREWAFTYEI